MPRRVVRGVAQGTPAAPQHGAALLATLKEINKAWGDGLVMQANAIQQPVRIPTGIFALDLATCGGIPVRGISMFHGRRSSGKTTSALKTLAMAQKLWPDKTHIFVDAEHALETVWAEKLGVDVDRLLVVKPETGEQAVDMIDALLQTPDVGLMVLDCIAALIPMKELDNSAEDAHVGIHAKLVTTLMRRVTAAFSKARQTGRMMAFLCINQERAGIGKWAPPGQEAINLPGGKALDHYTMLQVKFKNKENISKDHQGIETLEFNEHAFQIDKNKMNAGLRKGEFQLMRRPNPEKNLFEGDLDDCGTMIAYAKKVGIYTGGGSSWTLDLNGRPLKFKSADDACQHFQEDFDEFWDLRNHLIALHAAKLGMPASFVQRFYE